jgi:uncharacterized protein (TIGR00297 family)
MAIPLALAVSLAVALGGRSVRALTWSGALAATLVGFGILGSCGWPGAIVLGIFFVPTTLVGRLTGGVPEVRTATQVIANGGPAAVGSLLELVTPSLGLWVVTASLAAASADTWSTSLGRLSKRNPILLGTSRRVPAGTSGGVSIPGTLGGVAGAALVALAGGFLLPGWGWFGVGLAVGTGGMFLDSLLGAWVQGRYLCPACRVPTEARLHCGQQAVLGSGWGWLDNDGVNFLTTLFAALAGLVVWELR